MKRLLIHKNKLYTLYRALVLFESDLKKNKKTVKDDMEVIMERLQLIIKTAEEYEREEKA